MLALCPMAKLVQAAGDTPCFLRRQLITHPLCQDHLARNSDRSTLSTRVDSNWRFFSSTGLTCARKGGEIHKTTPFDARRNVRIVCRVAWSRSNESCAEVLALHLNTNLGVRKLDVRLRDE